MEIRSVKLVTFSPTGTSKAVAKAIARGMNFETTETVDATRPDVREGTLKTPADELLVIAVPVYMGRVPEIATEWLKTVQADKTPAVCAVVYGNREYDDALLELKDMMTDCGCVPIAGAAYIGEHSFSSPDLPTAQGRPDMSDLEHAEAFGQKVREKLESLSSIEEAGELSVPGNSPYGGKTTLWDVDFIAVNDDCTQCGLCAKLCPVGAIDPQNSAVIDIQKCITCCVCIKKCPQQAKSIKPGPVNDAANRLNTNCSTRKEPVNFL